MTVYGSSDGDFIRFIGSLQPATVQLKRTNEIREGKYDRWRNKLIWCSQIFMFAEGLNAHPENREDL